MKNDLQQVIQMFTQLSTSQDNFLTQYTGSTESLGFAWQQTRIMISPSLKNNGSTA